MSKSIAPISRWSHPLRLLSLTQHSEKNEMTQEAQQLITAIKQMEESLVDEKANGQYNLDHNDLRISYPLNRCLNFLREKHSALSKLHRERFEQVKSMCRVPLYLYDRH
jgi:protein regulator of cytokinesis 1